MKKSRSNALVHVCAFMLFVLSISSCKPKYPFENKPHTQYMGLKGKVRDIHMSFFIEQIGEHGYMPAEIASLNQFGVLRSYEFNPIYNMLFLNMISTYREDVDIFFSPLKYIKENVVFTPFVDDMSFTFNKKGFLNNVSWYYDKDLIAYIDVKYDRKGFITEIDQNTSHTRETEFYYAVFRGGERPSSPYEILWNRNMSYDYIKTDSILKFVEKIKQTSSKGIISTSIDTTIYKNKNNHIEVFLNKIAFPIFYLYLDSKGNISKIDKYHKKTKIGTALLKNNYIYSVLNDSPFDAKSSIELDNEGKIRKVNVRSGINLNIAYENNIISQIIESFFDEKIIYNIEYTFDNYENWTQMKISIDRSPYDKLLNELKSINKQIINIISRESNKVYHDGYFIERYLLNNEFQSLKSEYDDKSRELKILERRNNRYIIRRNISYY